MLPGMLTLVAPVGVPGVGHQPVGRPALRAPAQDLDSVTPQEFVGGLLVDTFMLDRAREQHSAKNLIQ